MATTAFRDDVGPRRPARRAGVRAGAVAPFALAVSACGALSADPESPIVLTTFAVEVSVPTTARNPHVALVWQGQRVALLQGSNELPLAPGHHGALSIPIRTAPPLDAIHRVDVAAGESTAFGFAVGALVAYEEVDGRPGFTEGDPALALSRTTYVVWLERPPSAAEARLLADGAGRVPVAGFNFQRLDKPGARWLSPTDPSPRLDTPTDGQPLTLPDRVCSPLYGPVPDAPLPAYDLITTFPPEGAFELSCAARTLVVRICYADRVCAARLDCSRTRTLAPTEQPPPGWPCPVQ